MTKRTPFNKNDAWAEKIIAAHCETIEGIFKTGDLLLAAKEEIGHGSWERFIEDKLTFGYDTANRLMKIARSAQLRKVAALRLLPCSYTTLEVLSKLDEAAFEKAVEEGNVHPDMTGLDAAVLCRNQPSVIEHVKQENAKDTYPTPEALGGWLTSAAPIVPDETLMEELVKARENYIGRCRALGPAAYQQELEYIARWMAQQYDKDSHFLH